MTFEDIRKHYDVTVRKVDDYTEIEVETGDHTYTVVNKDIETAKDYICQMVPEPAKRIRIEFNSRYDTDFLRKRLNMLKDLRVTYVDDLRKIEQMTQKYDRPNEKGSPAMGGVEYDNRT
jgi:hypothetical protein